MKRPRVLLLNLSGIRCRSTSKMATQSYSQDINQLGVSGFFDTLIVIGYLKLEQLNLCEACCVNGRHGTNTSTFKIFQDAFI